MSLSLESILLFSLISFRFLMSWGVMSGMEVFFRFLFPIVLCALYVGTDFWNSAGVFRSSVRSMALVTIIFLSILTSFAVSIGKRVETGVNPNIIHDGALQTEIAVEFLRRGENPYRADFHGTPLEAYGGGELELISDVHIENPALDYFVYPPLYLGFSWALSFVGELLFGWYDQRALLLIFYLLFIFFVLKLVRLRDRELACILLFINPLLLEQAMYGFNDIVPIALFASAVWFATKEKFASASFMFALMIGVKHLFTPLLTMFAVFMVLRARKECGSWREAFVKLFRMTWPFFPTLVLLFIPVWIITGKQFIDALVLYPSGYLPDSYPMGGFGFAQMLTMLGLRHPQDFFPFWIVQAATLVPLAIFFIRRQRRANTLAWAAIHAALFFAVFLFFSRMFHVNYFAAVVTLLIFVFFLLRKEEHTHSAQEFRCRDSYL